MLDKEISIDLAKLGYKGMLQYFEENIELKIFSISFQQSLKKLVKAELAHRSISALIIMLKS